MSAAESGGGREESEVREDPVLRIAGLKVGYHSSRGVVPALRGVDLELRRGEVLALVGESGSGKSTLAQSIVGLLAPGGVVEEGTITLNGRDVAGWKERRLRTVRGREVGLVPQDPSVSLNPVKRIGAQVAEAVTAHRRLPRARARAVAVEALERAGLDQPGVRARQYPHELSGGMRQRVLIAIGLAGDPDLLIADEPTSALDVTVQRRILDHLGDLTQQIGTAVLLVTHDLGVAADRADRIVVMHGGRVVEHGPVEQILHRPQHPYTERLIAAAPGLGLGEGEIKPDGGSGGAESRRTAATTGPLRTAVDRIATTAAEGTAAEGTVAEGTAAEPLVRVESLTKEFALPGGWGARGGARSIRAVDDVSFTINRGETFALVGESGSGKSTTGRLVLRLAEPTSGTVTFDGTDITAVKGEAWRQLRRRAQLIYQNPYASLDPRFTVEEIVIEPLQAFGVGNRGAERLQVARRLLDRVALPGDLAQRYPAELSGGQRQRVAIARALALSPDLVVCDEAVSALDVSVQAQVLDLLAELQREAGLTYLFITHDLGVVAQIAHRVAVMRSGAFVEVAPTAELFAAPQHEYTRDLLAAIAGTRREGVAA